MASSHVGFQNDVKYQEGYVHVSVKLGSMDFFQKRVDVCKKA